MIRPYSGDGFKAVASLEWIICPVGKVYVIGANVGSRGFLTKLSRMPFQRLSTGP